MNYLTITGRSFDLNKLNKKERRYLIVILELYHKNLGWSDFSAKWNKLFDKECFEETPPTYRICQDLEARLGIEQGKVALPDYRDQIADIIEEKYDSRYKFCKETGVDSGYLSRVLSGHSDLSIGSLCHLLAKLQAVFIIEPKQEIRSHNSEEITDFLEYLNKPTE